MSDDLQQAPIPQPEMPAAQPTGSTPPQPKKLNATILIVAGVGVVMAIFAVCTVACLAAFGTSLFAVFTERAPIESVLDQYMRHMDDKDADSAYALFSPRAQRQFSVSDIEELLVGNNYIVFEGYQSLAVENLNITAGANTNPNIPQGTVANVTGVIAYDHNFQGTFNAILEKVGDRWMIHGVNVTVPPNKLK